MRHLFISREQLAAIAATEELFYLTDDPPKISVPDGMRVLLRDGDTMVWTNAPERTGSNETPSAHEGGTSDDTRRHVTGAVPRGKG